MKIAKKGCKKVSVSISVRNPPLRGVACFTFTGCLHDKNSGVVCVEIQLWLSHILWFELEIDLRVVVWSYWETTNLYHNVAISGKDQKLYDSWDHISSVSALLSLVEAIFSQVYGFFFRHTDIENVPGLDKESHGKTEFTRFFFPPAQEPKSDLPDIVSSWTREVSFVSL